MSSNGEELPRGWVSGKFNDLCHLRNGYAVKSKLYTETGFPVLRQSNLTGHVVNMDNCKFVSDETASELSQHYVHHGDILIGLSGSIGEPSKYLEQQPSIQNQRTGLLIPAMGEKSKAFCAWFLKHVHSKLLTKAKGMAVQNISSKDIHQFEIQIPPLAEQERIVDKIDELFSAIEAGERAIEQARIGVARYRKAILKAAVTGELTKDWRDENPAKESAEGLLTRILTARYKAWEKAELEKLDAKGKARPETEKQWEKFRARYKGAKVSELEKLPSIPSNWLWSSIDQILDATPNSLVDGPFGSKLKREHYRESGVRVLRLENIGDGVFVDKKSYVSEEHAKTLFRHSVKSGDLAIATLGQELPRVCIVPELFGEGIVKADCLKCRPDREIGSFYIKFWLDSAVLKDLVSDKIRGVGRPRLNLGDLRCFPVPLPPKDEIHEIVDRVEQALSKADAVEATLDAQSRAAKALKQAVLKTAFEGKLVPQNPNDEPASELLKRIKEET